ncbi:MAG: beta-ketoacyl-ACP synthase III [Clostridia bacterium]
MKILGTGSALPERVVTNFDLTKFLDTSDEWISSRTGIRERRLVTDESVLSLAQAAAERALCDAGLCAQDIDLILCSTLAGDYVTPALACELQAALGARCAGFDLNNACPGFLYALDVSDAYIASGKAKHVLIVCAEIMSRLCDWRDRSTCVLFGDGAGAVVVGPGDGLMRTHLTCAGNAGVLHLVPDQGNSPFETKKRAASSLYMDGSEVYKFAVSAAVADIRSVMEKAGLSPEQVDLFVLHQANKRILEAVRTRLKQPEEKFPANISVRGNTASASVPILLDELNRAGALCAGQVLVMSAFGAGLTTAACALRWTKARAAG